MAELTNLESKLGEVIGLAMAAQGATQKVTKLDDVEGDLATTLERMQQEAKEAEERGTEVAGTFEGMSVENLGDERPRDRNSLIRDECLAHCSTPFGSSPAIVAATGAHRILEPRSRPPSPQTKVTAFADGGRSAAAKEQFDTINHMRQFIQAVVKLGAAGIGLRAQFFRLAQRAGGRGSRRLQPVPRRLRPPRRDRAAVPHVRTAGVVGGGQVDAGQQLRRRGRPARG